MEANPPQTKEIGREEAFLGRADHWLPAEAEAGVAIKDLCRKHGFSEASYYLWRSQLDRELLDSGHRITCAPRRLRESFDEIFRRKI